MWTFINTWNNMLALRHLSGKLLLCSLSARHRSSAGHQMQQGKRVFRCRLLVLTRHQFAVDDYTRIIRASGPRIKRARFFENGLRKVRDQKSASEHGLQLPVTFQRVSGVILDQILNAPSLEPFKNLTGEQFVRGALENMTHYELPDSGLGGSRVCRIGRKGTTCCRRGAAR